MKKFSDFNIEPKTQMSLTGLKIKMSGVLNRDIIVGTYQIKDSKIEGKGKCLYLQLKVDGIQRVLFTGSEFLMDAIKQINEFPFTTRIVEKDQAYHFS